MTDHASTEQKLTAVHRPAGTAPMTWAMGSLFEQVLSGEESGGPLGVALVTQPPGVATPLHRHTHESEAFFLIDGSMTYRAGDDMFRLDAGDFIWLPMGLPHAFRVTGRTPARMLALTTPGGLLRLYDEVGVPAAERRLPNGDGRPMPEEIARWGEIGPRYGLEVVGPPIPEDV
ncbi:MAG: cupin domain-containing protein [Candidatus Nanopelagicales bacterium]